MRLRQDRKATGISLRTPQQVKGKLSGVTKAPLNTGKGSVSRKAPLKLIDSRNDGKPESIFKSHHNVSIEATINRFKSFSRISSRSPET